MAKKKKYYVVWHGNRPGVYDNWTDCQLQIKNYPGAKYKSFKTKEEALQAFKGDYSEYYDYNKDSSIPRTKGGIDWRDVVEKNSIAVDAACSGNPGVMEYQGVVTHTGKLLFRQGPYQDGTNNVGEFLALVHALAMLKKAGKNDTVIYTDSLTAMAWVRNIKIKTNLKMNDRNKVLFGLMDRALIWLKTNSYSNPIKKWDTVNWGEIPADFGRK